MNLRRACICVVGVALLAAASGCSHEQRDWHAAQAADTIEAYDQFVKAHPASALSTSARTRIAQLTEARDWQRASTIDTADAYRQFLAQHPEGKSAQEARIRIENFGLNGAAAARHRRALRRSRRALRQPAAAPLRRSVRAPAAACKPPGSGSRRSYGIQLGAFSTAGAGSEANGSDSPRATNQSSMAPSPMLSAARAKAGTTSIACKGNGCKLRRGRERSARH